MPFEKTRTQKTGIIMPLLCKYSIIYNQKVVKKTSAADPQRLCGIALESSLYLKNIF
jgi:hypothetical protein